MATNVISHAVIRGGAWHANLTLPEEHGLPRITVRHLDQALDRVSVSADPEQAGLWKIRAPIPSELLNDGVHTFLVVDEESGETLDSFAIVTGTILEQDVRAEIALLRAELDMLKGAFRRHVLSAQGS